MLGHVVKRVRMWREVEPFYPDQTRGLPKSSESRGTESVLNALVLAARDASTGTLATMRGSVREHVGAAVHSRRFEGRLGVAEFPLRAVGVHRIGVSYGAALAALAVGIAPGGYASSPEIQDRLKMLREYLQQTVEKERLFNRLAVLWAGTTMPILLTPEQRPTGNPRRCRQRRSRRTAGGPPRAWGRGNERRHTARDRERWLRDRPRRRAQLAGVDPPTRSSAARWRGSRGTRTRRPVSGPRRR